MKEPSFANVGGGALASAASSFGFLSSAPEPCSFAIDCLLVFAKTDDPQTLFFL